MLNGLSVADMAKKEFERIFKRLTSKASAKAARALMSATPQQLRSNYKDVRILSDVEHLYCSNCMEPVSDLKKTGHECKYGGAVKLWRKLDGVWWYHNA